MKKKYFSQSPGLVIDFCHKTWTPIIGFILHMMHGIDKMASECIPNSLKAMECPFYDDCLTGNIM